MSTTTAKQSEAKTMMRASGHSLRNMLKPLPTWSRILPERNARRFPRSPLVSSGDFSDNALSSLRSLVSLKANVAFNDSMAKVYVSASREKKEFPPSSVSSVGGAPALLRSVPPISRIISPTTSGSRRLTSIVDMSQSRPVVLSLMLRRTSARSSLVSTTVPVRVRKMASIHDATSANDKTNLEASMRPRKSRIFAKSEFLISIALRFTSA
mmetsp:Transcript_31621/g.74204  ORF Transcript_31621/g.74204 Transcript_31621/m.74204 type:complete len:211 (-) Transcript_31621:5-637(-)